MDGGQFVTLFPGAGTDLLRLFRNGEDGFLFYPMSDLTRLYRHSTADAPNQGGGPVTADADPVGLDLDSHAWPNGATLTSWLSSQTELILSNTTFATDLSGWTAAHIGAGADPVWDSGNGGRASFTRVDGSNYGYIDQTITTAAGKPYLLTVSATQNALFIGAATTQGGSDLGQVSVQAGTSSSLYFIATGATTHIVLQSANGQAFADNPTCKVVPGNHALQATTTKRPLWKANSGKPYLIGDGTDDVLTSPFVPTAACTIAFAGNFDPTDGSGSSVLMGGGGTTGSHRLNVGCSASGIVGFGWGADNLTVATAPGLGDIRGQDHVYVVTGDAVTVDFWVDNAVAHTRAANGSPAGGTGGLSLCCYNNAGAPGNFSKGRVYAWLALNRRVTPAEIALITSQFRSAYQ